MTEHNYSKPEIKEALIIARNKLSSIFNECKKYNWENIGQDKKNWFSFLCHAMGDLDLTIQKLTQEIEKENKQK